MSQRDRLADMWRVKVDEQTLKRIKEKVLSLPYKPGVYIMLDKSGEVIYVGKAKQLKNRVSQYFQDSQNHTKKTKNMVSNVNDFNYIVADSEFEALVLECSLIKRHQPKYNILLKDGKGYPFIRIDLKQPFPKFEMDSKLKNDGARYFGPYGGRYTTKQVIDALGEVFHLPDCDRKFPRDIGKERPCLNFHMGRCYAPCAGKLSEEEHRDLVLRAVKLLEGKFEEVSKETYAEMEKAAEELRFEKAAALRDRYNAIIQLGKRQKVVSGTMADTDIVGAFFGAKRAIAVLHYIDGALLDKDVELIEQSVEEDVSSVLDAYLTQYYVGRPALPRQILLPCDIDNRESLEEMLSRAAERKVSIVVPKRGEKLELVKLAEKNAREEAERVTTRQDRNERNLILFQKALGMEKLPQRIEAYDISNLSGSDIVASMTVFKGGAPYRKGYRRFKIEGTDGQDDYGSMREVITRRFKRYLDGDEKFSEMPDILLIDGGDIHAKIALNAAKVLGIDLPVFGMVKDGRHRTRALQAPDGREIAISTNPQLFAFVGRIQEETHRFAIEYNRQLRKKRVYGSELDKIEGVGKARRAALIKHFGSVKRIREAGEDEIAAAVPKGVAAKVYAYFHQDSTEENTGG